MKWTKPDVGDVRVTRKFFWFPTPIGRSIFWLECQNVFYEYISHHGIGEYWKIRGVVESEEDINYFLALPLATFLVNGEWVANSNRKIYIDPATDYQV